MRLELPVLMACLALSACGSGEEAEGATFSPPAASLRAGPDALYDSLGRQVLLRGFNHPALRSDRNHPPYRVDGHITPSAELFELQDLEDADFDTLAGTGLNTLRLRMTWEFAQPDPPPAPYNESYFKLVDEALRKASARGMHVVLDFGQFGWSRDLGGNAGAPPWTSEETCRGLGLLPFGVPPHLSPPVLCQWTRFWQNAEKGGQGLQDHYLQLWRYVARRYRGNAAVAVFDVLNEPLGGAIPAGAFELSYLYPFYRRLAAEIRQHDPGRMIGFQPQVYHSAGIPTPFVEPIGIENSLYMPHEYTLAYSLQRLTPTWLPGYGPLTQAHAALAQEDGRRFGVPQAWGEVGWSRTSGADGVGGQIPVSDYEAPLRFAEVFAPVADSLQLSWMWANYSSISETYGINYGGVIDAPLLRLLARPYPRATAGRIESFSYDDARRIYRQRTRELFRASSEIGLAMRWLYPEGACIYGDSVLVAALDGTGQPHGGSAGALSFDGMRQTLILGDLPESLEITPAGDTCPLGAEPEPPT